MIDKNLFKFLRENCAVVCARKSEYIIYNPIGDNFFYKFRDYFSDRYKSKAGEGNGIYVITRKEDSVEEGISAEEWALNYCDNVQVKNGSKDIEMWNLQVSVEDIANGFCYQWFHERYKIFLDLESRDCILLKYVD